MTDQNLKEIIEKAIEEKITDDSIECEVAQDIAAELGVEPEQVGEVAQDLNLTLKNCKGIC